MNASSAFNFEPSAALRSPYNGLDDSRSDRTPGKTSTRVFTRSQSDMLLNDRSTSTTVDGNLTANPFLAPSLFDTDILLCLRLMRWSDCRLVRPAIESRLVNSFASRLIIASFSGHDCIVTSKS